MQKLDASREHRSSIPSLFDDDSSDHSFWTFPEHCVPQEISVDFIELAIIKHNSEKYQRIGDGRINCSSWDIYLQAEENKYSLTMYALPDKFSMPSQQNPQQAFMENIQPIEVIPSASTEL